MANPNRRGQAGDPVSTGMQGASYTPFANTHFILPYGLRLQQKVGMVDITNVVDAGATVVYTANNNYSTGNIVSIYGVDPVAYNLQNATVLSATSTDFTITNAATGTYVSGGVAQRTGEQNVTIPAGINFVYVIMTGGGEAGERAQITTGGGSGGVSWGWTVPSPTCIIGAGGTTSGLDGGFSRYGNVIAGGGGGTATLGSGGGAGVSGATNYWGIPGGVNGATRLNGQSGSGAGGGGGTATLNTSGGNGGSGISGGAGGSASVTGSGTMTGGNGGSGLVGGGGGGAGGNTGTRTGGNGGNGINILTGAVTTGGTGTVGTSANGGGGGGGGMAGNGTNAVTTTGGAGGLGGGGGGGGPTSSDQGGSGGAGILYLFY